VVSDAAPAFRAAVGRGRAATVLRVLPAADPWLPALLGAARRRALGSGALTEDAAAAHFRRRLAAELAHLSARAAMPPHVRSSLNAHILGMLGAHEEGSASAIALAPSVLARSPSAGTDAAARPAGGITHPPDSVGRVRAAAAGRSHADSRRPPIPAAQVLAVAKTTTTSMTVGITPAAADYAVLLSSAHGADQGLRNQAFSVALGYIPHPLTCTLD